MLIHDITGMTDEELDRTQLGLGAAGMAPGGFVADIADAGISLGRGDILGAILAGLSAAPILGMAAGGLNASRKAAKAAKASKAISEAEPEKVANIQELSDKLRRQAKLEEERAFNQTMGAKKAKFSRLRRKFNRLKAMIPVEPRVWYHGTDSPDDFTIFDTRGMGTHFGTAGAARDRLSDVSWVRANQRPTEWTAAGSPFTQYNRTIPVYLEAKRPLRMDDAGAWDDSVNVAHKVLDSAPQSFLDKRRKELTEILGESRQDKRDYALSEFADETDFSRLPIQATPWSESIENQQYLDDIKGIMQAEGYDSIRYKNNVEDLGRDSLIIFDPENIKSYRANVGSYGQRPPTAKEAASLGMSVEEAIRAQKSGDIRLSLLPAAVGGGALASHSMSEDDFVRSIL